MRTSTTSVVIPTRDRARQLSNCLASLDQHGYLNMQDVQVVVVDNDSLEWNTRELCKLYSNVTYILEKKHGRSAALNAGIRRAEGDYVASIDDDVIVRDPNWLSCLRRNFQEDPSVEGWTSE